jgi:hypothetical protein
MNKKYTIISILGAFFFLKSISNFTVEQYGTRPGNQLTMKYGRRMANDFVVLSLFAVAIFFIAGFSKSFFFFFQKKIGSLLTFHDR